MPDKITALASLNDITFVSAGNIIYVVDRNVVISKMELKKEVIGSLAICGELLVASGQSSVYLFDLKAYGKECINESFFSIYF